MDEQHRDPRGREVDIGLSLDEAGRFHIHGEPVTHQRTHDALTRNLWADEDGRVCTRIGYEWSPVRVKDTPLLVQGVDFETEPTVPAVPWLALSDGTAERLRPETLWLEGDRLYSRVRGGTLEARFLPTAAAGLLLQGLEGDESSPRARFGDQVVDLGQSKRRPAVPATGVAVSDREASA